MSDQLCYVAVPLKQLGAAKNAFGVTELSPAQYVNHVIASISKDMPDDSGLGTKPVEQEMAFVVMSGAVNTPQLKAVENMGGINYGSRIGEFVGDLMQDARYATADAAKEAYDFAQTGVLPGSEDASDVTTIVVMDPTQSYPEPSM